MSLCTTYPVNVIPQGQPKSDRLSQTASFYLLASITVSYLASSSAPTPLYPIYQAEWGFSPLAITFVFGIYAVAVLGALLVAGRLSDFLGRRPVLIVATMVQAATMLLFAFAGGLSTLVVARIIQGLSTGAAIAAVGAGMNQAEMLVKFAKQADFDCFLLAGRYTLLDQVGLEELLPLCLDRDIAIIAGGVYNSGILADPRPGTHYNYATASGELVDHAQRLNAVCARHGVPLKAAAIQFPLGHPAVTSVLIGCRSATEIDENITMFETPIPGELWAELKAERLLGAEIPTP